jgi:hypothetical protein
MDTEMHALAMPGEDPSALARPEDVARRIVAMLEDEARAPNGSRLLASHWRNAS